MTVTWADVAAVCEARGAPKRFERWNGRRIWRVPSPTGGTFTAEVSLKPRWCEIAVDRWRTTDRDVTRAEPWFKEHVWPLVDHALIAKRGSWGMLPSGHTIASAHPIERTAVPGLLEEWLDAELAWGIRADEQWPEFAPHKVIPGPAGNYGGPKLPDGEAG